MNIVDLFARIGLKTDEAKAKSFAKSINSIKVGLVAATTTAAAASIAIKKVTDDALRMAVSFKQFETETGASAQQLQKWQSVVEQTNQPIEQVTAAIKSLSANREKIKLGQGDISGYQLLGIDPNQDPFEILEDLRAKTQGLSQAMKKNILSSFGVGSGMIQALEMTNEEFNRLSANSFIISPSAINTLNQAKSSIDLAGRAINYMKTQIAVGLAPQLQRLTKRTTEFIKKNEDGIIKGFQIAFKWVTKFTGAIINTVTGINNLVTATIGWKAGIGVVVAALAVLNAQLLLSPIGLMTAGLLLLIAVMDDLYIYSQGGKSLFGNMMDKFPKLNEAVTGIKDFVTAIKEGNIDNLLEQWGTWGDIVQGIVDGLRKIKEWSEKTNAVQKTKDLIIPSEEGESRLKAGIEKQQAKEQELKNMSTTEYLGYLKDSLLGLFGKGGNTENNINMNVYGTSDPETTGTVASRMIIDQLNAASAQMARDE